MVHQLRPETTYGAIIGSVITIQRKSVGIEQAHLAADLGVTQATWSRIESGASPLNVDQLVKASRSLGLSPAEIVRRADRAHANLTQQGVIVRYGSTKELARDGFAIIAAVALCALVVAALSSK